MPVRATAAIRIISTTAGVVTFCVLRKMLSLPASRVIHDDEDVRTVYINPDGTRSTLNTRGVEAPRVHKDPVHGRYVSAR